MAKVGTVDRLVPNSVYQSSLSKNPSAFQNRRKKEIFIECNDLIQLDKFSKSDPLCVLHVKKLGNWTEYGRTESLPNNLNPKVSELVARVLAFLKKLRVYRLESFHHLSS